jgi:Phage lysozyme
MSLSEDGRRFLAQQEGMSPVTLRPHWPEGSSGVTLGWGYDMRWRSPEQVRTDLVAIGIDPGVADVVATASGRFGDREAPAGSREEGAKQWVARNAGLITLTPQQREALFHRTLPEYESIVRRTVRVQLNPNEFAALVSFAYNTGRTWFQQGSEAIRRLNEGDCLGATVLMAGERIGSSAGVRARRAREVALFQRP